MGHYELLGVTPDASMGEIKRNYLALACTSHPDLHASSETARHAAEERMRSLNEAWAVLGDVDERSVYDRRRLRDIRETQQVATRPRSPFHASAAAHEASSRFDDEFDERHDSPITPSALPQWLALTPAFFLIGGLAGLLMGSIVNAAALVVLGLISMIVSGVLFVVAAPLVALGRAARAERLS